jgi:CBS domain-containing protein
MSIEFHFDLPPYDALSEAERSKFASALDIGFYAAGARPLKVGDRPDHLFIVMKGVVHERADDELFNVLTTTDTFDSTALLEGLTQHEFRVEEDLVAWLAPRQVFLDLVDANPRFGAFFTGSLAEKLRSRVERESQVALSSFLTSRVGDAAIAPPVFHDAQRSLHDAAQLLRHARAHTLLIRDGARVGIASRTELGDAVLLHGMLPDDPVGPIAHWEPVTVAADDLLSDAMFLMTKHAIRRLVVTRDGDIVGVLELAALLGHIVNQSHMVSTQIRRATTLDELRPVCAAIDRLVRTLFANGTKTRTIAALVTELNQSLFRQLFRLLAPDDLATGACLVVMGSEGRGEQTLRTDQDNALLLPDGTDVFAARRIAERFSEALSSFGFPPCPGGMMVSNPAWTRTVSDFRDQIHRWVSLTSQDAFLPLAALVDAAPASGDDTLLVGLKEYLIDRVRGDASFLARFARATLTFDTPRGLLPAALRGLTEWTDGLDLKKAGLFPVVHGARSLALDKGIMATSTEGRISCLADDGLLGASFAADLCEAFHFLLHLRLKTGLAAAPGTGLPGDVVHWSALPRGEEQLLKHSLRVVIDFKQLVSHHFRLALL